MAESCMELEREKLGPMVDLELNAPLDFGSAQAQAWTVARRLKKDPMLLAWYDRAAGRFSPPVTCCGEDRPAWVVYAQSRGADLAVSVNREEFVFLFWGEPA